MHKINLKSNNKWFLIISFILILSLIVLPLLSIIIAYIIPSLSFRNYLNNNISFVLIPILSSLYFLIARINYYTLKIDSYVLEIKIYKTGFLSAFGFSFPKDYLDISHEMFEGFCFYNRPFSFNKTLMIKIKKDSGKVVVKRFNVSFISETEEVRISKVFKQIIAKNR